MGACSAGFPKATFVGAQNLTEAIRKQLETLIIGINDKQTDELVNDIEMLYKLKISKDLGISKGDKDAEFKLTKNIVEVVNFFINNDPERAENMRFRIKQYLNNLKDIGLEDSDLESNKQNTSLIASTLKAFFTIILGFPVFVYGLINSYLPFEIPGWIADKISKSIEFRGALGMVIGMFTFLIFYSTQIIIVWKCTHVLWITAAYGLSLPLTGLFGYWYYHAIAKIRSKWLLMMIFFKKSVFISNLISEREQIISEFDKARMEYDMNKI